MASNNFDYFFQRVSETKGFWFFVIFQKIYMIVKFVEMLILYFFCNFILYVANILPFAVPEVELTNFIESLWQVPYAA